MVRQSIRHWRMQLTERVQWILSRKTFPELGVCTRQRRLYLYIGRQLSVFFCSRVFFFASVKPTEPLALIMQEVEFNKKWSLIAQKILLFLESRKNRQKKYKERVRTSQRSSLSATCICIRTLRSSFLLRLITLELNRPADNAENISILFIAAMQH